MTSQIKSSDVTLATIEKPHKIRDDNQSIHNGVINEEFNANLRSTSPTSGSRNWTDVRQFNLMFNTSMGAVTDESNIIYLRPETAQGIFVNFLNVQKTGRM